MNNLWQQHRINTIYFRNFFIYLYNVLSLHSLIYKQESESSILFATENRMKKKTDRHSGNWATLKPFVLTFPKCGTNLCLNRTEYAAMLCEPRLLPLFTHYQLYFNGAKNFWYIVIFRIGLFIEHIACIWYHKSSKQPFNKIKWDF